MLKISWKEKTFVSLNAATLAIFYTLLGALVSYALYHIFDEFDEEWKKKPTWYKFLDVSVEISLLAVIAFWSEHLVDLAPPIFKVHREMDRLVDSFISGIFYVFAIFLFMDSMNEKLRFLYHEVLEVYFSKIFPQHGSLINLSLSYKPLTKTEK